jgi:hypothetical protein
VWSALADLVVLAHLLFVLFAVAGGALVLYRRRLAWLHVPAAAWAVFIELSGGICPLTPLENELRRRAGGPTYDGSFVEQYVIPLLYPAALTRDQQWLLGGVVILVNVAVYGVVLTRRRHPAVR